MITLTSFNRAWICAVSVLLCNSVQLLAQDSVEAKQALSLVDVLKTEASDYKIILQDDGKSVLTMHPEPVLAWVNPVRYQQQGLVYVWTDQGRARAIGGVFTNYLSDVRMYTTHEFHSLSPVGLKADHAGKDVWHPEEAGVTFQILNDAPTPTMKKPGRLAQMRRLAREFSASSITQEGSRYELRLLTAPLFRYQAEEADIHDGAVFSMVTSAGTDPELLLIFEVRDTPAGPRWHYAPARFSDSKLFLQHKEKSVWEFVYPDGVAGYKHKVSPEDRYRLWDNREFTPDEIKQLLKNAKSQSAVPSPQ